MQMQPLSVYWMTVRSSWNTRMKRMIRQSLNIIYNDYRPLSGPVGLSCSGTVVQYDSSFTPT